MEKLLNNELLVGKNNTLEIRSKIYEIRGEKVMLDFDLAKIYGYETKQFNRQVKNNIDKFEGSDFMFKLTRDEVDDLVRCNFCTSRDMKLFTGQAGGSRYLPYAFTESGIYMLMTVLKGDLATKQSRTLIRLFRSMKDYILQNQNFDLAKEVTSLENRVDKMDKELSNMLRRSEVSPILLSFTPDVKKELVFVNGELTRASDAYINIYSKAKKSIIIIDDYIDIKTLLHLRNIKSNLKVTIFSDNKANTLRLCDYNDFKKDYKINIELIHTNKQIHDRFIILDINEPTEECYHSGSSTKDTGKSLTMLTKMEDGLAKTILKNIVANMINNNKLELR